MAVVMLDRSRHFIDAWRMTVEYEVGFDVSRAEACRMEGDDDLQNDSSAAKSLHVMWIHLVSARKRRVAQMSQV